MWQVSVVLPGSLESVVCVWIPGSDGIYPLVGRSLVPLLERGYAGWLQVADVRQLDDDMDMASVVLRWHSLHTSVQDDPPYCRAFRLPLS